MVIEYFPQPFNDTKAGASQRRTYLDGILSCVLIGNLRCAKKMRAAS